MFLYTSDLFWSLRTRLGPDSSKLEAEDSSSVDTATDAIYKPRRAHSIAISFLGLYHFIFYLKVLPVFICIWASNTSETMNILKIRASSSESERKGILWHPGQWTKATVITLIFFKRGQLGPGRADTKQELQSPGKLVLIQVSNLWAQSAKQSEMQGCLP